MKDGYCADSVSGLPYEFDYPTKLRAKEPVKEVRKQGGGRGQQYGI